MKLEALLGSTPRHPSRTPLQGPLEGRTAAHPFAAEWKAIPGHFGRA